MGQFDWTRDALRGVPDHQMSRLLLFFIARVLIGHLGHILSFLSNLHIRDLMIHLGRNGVHGGGMGT